MAAPRTNGRVARARRPRRRPFPAGEEAANAGASGSPPTDGSTKAVYLVGHCLYSPLPSSAPVQFFESLSFLQSAVPVQSQKLWLGLSW